MIMNMQPFELGGKTYEQYEKEIVLQTQLGMFKKEVVAKLTTCKKDLKKSKPVEKGLFGLGKDKNAEYNAEVEEYNKKVTTHNQEIDIIISSINKAQLYSLNINDSTKIERALEFLGKILKISTDNKDPVEIFKKDGYLDCLNSIPAKWFEIDKHLVQYFDSRYFSWDRVSVEGAKELKAAFMQYKDDQARAKKQAEEEIAKTNFHKLYTGGDKDFTEYFQKRLAFQKVVKGKISKNLYGKIKDELDSYEKTDAFLKKIKGEGNLEWLEKLARDLCENKSNLEAFKVYERHLQNSVKKVDTAKKTDSTETSYSQLLPVLDTKSIATSTTENSQKLYPDLNFTKDKEQFSTTVSTDNERSYLDLKDQKIVEPFIFNEKLDSHMYDDQIKFTNSLGEISELQPSAPIDEKTVEQQRVPPPSMVAIMEKLKVRKDNQQQQSKKEDIQKIEIKQSSSTDVFEDEIIIYKGGNKTSEDKIELSEENSQEVVLETKEEVEELKLPEVPKDKLKTPEDEIDESIEEDQQTSVSVGQQLSC